MASRKDTEALIRRVRAQEGFEVSITGSGHYRIRPPTKDTPLIYVSVSPSDSKSLRAVLVQLRRAGFIERR